MLSCRLRVQITGACLAAFVLASKSALAATFTYGVMGPNEKIRPSANPKLESKTAELKAARNEFEPFQLVLRSSGGPTQQVWVSLEGPLQGPQGATIPESNVVLYRVGYYQVSIPSNTEGASGPWPDPLIPDVDSYVREKRNAFPLDIPAEQNRLVWVDILVPQDAAPGDYVGKLLLRIGTQQLGEVGIALRVGDFELPSTASLPSAFGMGWADPCQAHTGTDSCDPAWNEDKANTLRRLYLRAAIEHRFSISDTDFRPPFGASAAPFEAIVLPLILGTDKTRLPGARITAVRLDGKDTELAQWVDYAKAKGFFDRLFYYPVPEPSSQFEWNQFKASAEALHQVDPEGRIALTATVQDTDNVGLTEEVDIFVPVINFLEGRIGTSKYAGDQTPYYQNWLAGNPKRQLWARQSCQSHGCGNCGASTTDPYYTGWPQRVIDSSAVQNRCFPWLAFRLGLSGEMYFSVTDQLKTAWEISGLCKNGGSGDGTLFYPGKTSFLGGAHDIPVESIRLKLLREGMEDYEYLVLAAKKDATQARAIAADLFPTAYECAQKATKLETARDQLFALLQGVVDAGVADGPSKDAVADTGSIFVEAGAEASKDAGVEAGEPRVELLPLDAGGCGCETLPQRRPWPRTLGWAGVLGALAAFLRKRRAG